ncbi:MAG TPA: hypothetical protein VF104_09005 [Burkholderiales bacterium]
MLRFCKTLLLCLALTGLPLQGIAAVTMSFCKYGASDTAAQAGGSHAHHGASHCEQGKSADAKQPCNDCTPCHLCSALALPGTGAVAAPVVATSHYHTRLPLQPDGFLPDQPKPPPLA